MALEAKDLVFLLTLFESDLVTLEILKLLMQNTRIAIDVAFGAPTSLLPKT
jgi:hypothetical protein